MPPVPSVRGERVVRDLERAGFEVARMHGSHYVMRHPDGRGTAVPEHPPQLHSGRLHGLRHLTDGPAGASLHIP